MEILTIIEERWNPKTGLYLEVRKGTLVRFLNVPPYNKYDIWGYGTGNKRTGQSSLLLRGDARGGKNSYSFIMERGRKLKTPIADYLKDFVIVE